MKLSTRVRYGCRAMVDLVSKGTDAPVTLEAMARDQHISVRYLAKIIQDLRRSGIVRSTRGAHGGYTLSRPAEEITLLDIWESLDGPIYPVDCIAEPGECEMWDQCVTRDVWTRMKEAFEQVLGETTLAETAEKYKKRLASCKKGSTE